jgi:hypothetical protein
MSNIKRLYFYIVSYATLQVTAFGAVLLLSYVLDALLARGVIGGVTQRASLGIAMVIVGAPLWLLHWTFTRRQLERQPEEAGAVLRKLYVYGALFLAAVIGLFAFQFLVAYLLGTEDFSSVWAAQLIVWGGVWAFHWVQEQREGQPSSGSRTVRRWYLYGVSAVSLAFLVSGATNVLAVVITRAYDELFIGTTFTATPLWGDQMKGALSNVVPGGVWWGVHWLLFSRGDVESTLRQVYLYLFAFLFGAASVLVSTAIILFTVMQWLLGAPGADPNAAVHFRAIPNALPSLVVGLGILGYHWAVVQEESRALADRLPGARRSFRYIMSALGLGTLATGVVLLLGGVISFLFPVPGDPLTGTEAWRDPLALAFTLIFIGAPLWLWYWSRAQRHAQEEGLAERNALSRRIFLYVALGALALAAVGGLVGVLSILLEDILSGRLTLDFLREGKWFLSTAAAAAVFLVYYAQVLREDQRAGAEAAPRRKDVTVVVGEDQSDLVSLLEQRLGLRLRVFRVVEPSVQMASLPTEEDMARFAEQVRAAPTDRVLVVPERDGLRVYAYK